MKFTKNYYTNCFVNLLIIADDTFEFDYIWWTLNCCKYDFK